MILGQLAQFGIGGLKTSSPTVSKDDVEAFAEVFTAALPLVWAPKVHARVRRVVAKAFRLMADAAENP